MIGRSPPFRALMRQVDAVANTDLPVLLIGEHKLTGFNPAKIDEALATLGG